MSLSRRLAMGSVLSLALIAPHLAGCESDSSTAAQSDGGTTPSGDGGTGLDGSVASTCASLAGAGTKHDTAPAADETWTAAASPHVIDTSLTIPAGRTLTLEPCAVVQLKASVSLLVQGKLLAVGAADKPIRIERGDAATGWTTIEGRQGSELRLAYVTVDGGGNPGGGRPTQAAALDIRGDQDSPTQPILFADHLTVKGSQSLGVMLREGGGFAPGSKDVVVTGGVTFPVSSWARAAGTLPSGTNTGNAIDEILLPANGGRDDVQEDTTLHAYGVPYRVGGPTGGKSLAVQGAGSVPLLTIEAGVTLRFDKETRMEIKSSTISGPATGALRAEGTAAKPIVFTSSEASPAAGDWVGIVMTGKLDPRDKISGAKVAYAGGASQINSYDCPPSPSSGGENAGAILIIGEQPAAGLVTSTGIDSSAGHGIVRGWTGELVDFLSTNTFTNIATCNESYPRPLVGSCPATPPCPK